MAVSFINSKIAVVEQLTLMNTDALHEMPVAHTVGTNIMALGDFLLTPVRYFFNGRIVKITQTAENDAKKDIELLNEYGSKPGEVKKSWYRTAFFISVFILGLFFGIIVKGISSCFKDADSYQRTADLALSHRKLPAQN